MKSIHVVAFVATVLASGMVHAISVSRLSESKEYEVQVTVDTTGHISSIKPEQSLFDNYMLALKQAASTWQFGVPKANGVPVPCTTWVRVRFIRTRSDGEPRYTVEYIGNGPYIEIAKLPYPTNLYRWHISAIFYVRFVVEASGAIDNVQLVQAWTSGGKPIGDAMQDVTKGVMHLKTKPMLVDGHPISTPMIAPVSFIATYSLDEHKPDFGLEIASDSPNSGRSVGNIPESGTAVQ